jgi:BirA family biotin operon repressor/biotin-[acetyl-CoA-carboxylase] ligase
MDEREFRAAIGTSLVGRNLLYLERTGSTNSVASEAAREGAPDGTVVVAAEQTAGRGRLGRRWEAPAGTCLLCSVLFRPDLPLTRIQHLTMVCALAAADAIGELTGLRAALKWPNDLVVPAGSGSRPAGWWRKLAGLLTETGLSGERVEYVVVGIGINVNVPAEILPTLAPDATSLLAETGRPVDIPILLGSVLDGIERRYGLVRKGVSPLPEWAARLVTLGQVVEARTPAGKVVGVAEAVDDTGALLLRTSDGSVHSLVAGDVTLRPGKAAG